MKLISFLVSMLIVQLLIYLAFFTSEKFACGG